VNTCFCDFLWLLPGEVWSQIGAVISALNFRTF